MVLGTFQASCKLCGRYKRLRKSHIFPEFFYKTLYDEKHRVVGVTPWPEAKNPYLQKGLREYLLCEDCEGRFAVWERYAAIVLRELPDTASAKAGSVIEKTGVKYDTFKLFQMSVLWRAGVANHLTFSEVDLGLHESKLRAMLINANPGPPARYGCVLIGFRGGSLKQFGRPPIRCRVKGHRAYIFLACGLIWLYVISSHSEQMSGQGSFLTTDGILRIHVGPVAAADFIRGLASWLKTKGLI